MKHHKHPRLLSAFRSPPGAVVAGWVLGLWLGSPVAAQPVPTAPPPASMAPLACLILPERVADIGSAVIGIVDAIEVERGDTVRKGQVLVRLRAEVERANNEVARSRALSEAELRGALAARDLAQLKLDRSRSLKAENFISTQAVEQAHAELRVAHEKVAQARENLRTLAQEVHMSDAQASQRVLRSPFDGVVTERYANPGERFEDKPLLKVAAIHRLRVEVVAPTALFGSLKPGQEVMVSPELPGAAPRSARIAQIDRVLDPASNTFRMRLDLPNADASLPAGLRCKVDLGLQTARPPASPASGTSTR
nr:efflux RND transporter periplasmic adaptor subunit [uncultured Albidiferax sp.]